jgi:NitT/TauT family transport system substrate-binding protein
MELFVVKRSTMRGTAAAGALALLIAGCGGGDDAGSAATDAGGSSGPIKIVAGVAVSPSSAVLLVGQDQVFFEEEGIELELAQAASAAGGVPNLINGQLDVVLGGISGVVTAVASGIPVQFVSGAVTDVETPQGTIYQTMVAPDSGIASFADLEGKTVAVNSLNCCWDFWIREAVEKDGGDPSTLKLVQLPFPDQAGALRNGDVDAVSTLQPFATQLRQEGFVDIGDSPAVAYDDPENGNTNYFMATSFLQENPDLLERWQRALQRASDYANENPDEVRALIVERVGTPAELVEQAPLPFYTAELDIETIEKEAEFAVKYKVIEEAPSIEELVATPEEFE